jgi:hypothetical protein
MSTRIQEWLQTENTVVKSYEQLQDEQPEVMNALEYNEKVVKPWMEQNQMENEIRKQCGVPPDWATDAEKIEFHRRQLALLEKANQAPRCGHVYSDGRRCGGPRLRKDKVCYAHARMLAVRPRKLNLPPLEDANAVMLWLMEVSRALLEGEITERTAGLMFYGLQLAMVTARWTTFAQTKPEEMVRSAPELGISPQRARKGAKVKKEFTAEDAEVAEEEGADKSALRAALRSAPGRTRNFTAKDAKGAKVKAALAERKPVAAVADIKIAGVNAGDESAKSLSFGDEGEEGGRRSPEWRRSHVIAEIE